MKGVQMQSNPQCLLNILRN